MRQYYTVTVYQAEGNRSGQGKPEPCSLPKWYTLIVLSYRNKNTALNF